MILYDFRKPDYAKKLKEVFGITVEEYECKFDIMVLKINESEDVSKIQKKLSEIAYYYELELWDGSRYLSPLNKFSL
ncbi:MAG: hypothetical protein HYW78_02860 [Parcubacteria group bacterium]|nr:hypothetical protein [Parcubacteria group bacterium]